MASARPRETGLSGGPLATVAAGRGGEKHCGCRIDLAFCFPLGLLGAAAFALAQAGGAAADPQRLVSVGDVQIVEGDPGTKLAVFTITLDARSSPEGLRVAYSTQDGSALAGSDYVAISGVRTFPASGGEKTVAVPIFGDTVFEPDETFSLRVTLAYGAGVAHAVRRGRVRVLDKPLKRTVAVTTGHTYLARKP